MKILVMLSLISECVYELYMLNLGFRALLDGQSSAEQGSYVIMNELSDIN